MSCSFNAPGFPVIETGAHRMHVYDVSAIYRSASEYGYNLATVPRRRMVSKSLSAHGMRHSGRADGGLGGSSLVLMKSQEPSSKSG